MRAAAYIVLLLAGLILTSCGGGGGSQGAGASLDDVLTDVAGLSGAARTKELVKAAKADGGLSLYTTSSVDLISEITDAFGDAYDIDVSIFKTSNEGLLQRVTEEQKAGFHGADVVETNAVSLLNLSGTDALALYRSPSASGLAQGSVHVDWASDKVDNMVVVWNTKNVPEGEQPKSYEELADPKWRGKISLETGDADWYQALWQYWVKSGKTPAEADRLFAAIGRNAIVVPHRSLQRELLIAGEFDVATTQQRHNIQHDIDEGAPLAYEPIVEPVVTRPDGVAIVSEPPHPAAAVLFVDWLLGDGEKVISDFGADATRNDLVVAPSVRRIAANIPDFVANQEKWEARWERVLGLGEEVPESG